jgi:hypothetical protein
VFLRMVGHGLLWIGISERVAVLKDARMLRFVAVSDRDYDPIREMERIANSCNMGSDP